MYLNYVFAFQYTFLTNLDLQVRIEALKASKSHAGLTLAQLTFNFQIKLA